MKTFVPYNLYRFYRDEKIEEAETREAKERGETLGKRHVGNPRSRKDDKGQVLCVCWFDTSGS